MKVQKKAQRIVSLDLIRTTAALMVVMIHCSSMFVKSFDTISREFVLGNFFDSISRAAVPLFVMTSGALLLDERRQFSVRKFYGRNVKNLALLLAFWSAFYAVLYQAVFPLVRGERADVPELIHDFIFGHYHMWYLYMAVGLYLITPFLRCVARRENAGLVRLFLGISLLTQFSVPLIQALAAIWEPLEYWNSLINKFRLQFFCGFTAYYLAGWYLAHVGLSRLERRILTAVGAISLAMIFVYVQLTGKYSIGYSNYSLLVFLYAAALFSVLYRIGNRLQGKKPGTVLEVCSGLSFGVYIIHPLLLRELREVIPYERAPLWYLLGTYVAVCAAAALLTRIGSALPGIRKVFRM
ncbi:MAG TPA: acyltransferase [Candidatus Pullilachnospira intestinigallinarum]|nr:acyltransferase [Candidatus Pullilachnospira intestinigallinarum]